MFTWLWGCLVIFFKGLIGMWIFIISFFTIIFSIAYLYKIFGGDLEGVMDQLKERTEKESENNDN